MQHEAYHILGEAGDIVIIADHASNHVPDGIDLGIDAALLNQHMAIDIGVAQVAALLVDRLPACAILGGVSRLVVDYNRVEDAAGLIPLESDGHVIPGNHGADREARLARYYRPYHTAIEDLLRGLSNPFILSLHSFTPQLQTAPEMQRPWDIGILYNRDDRAARIAIPMLETAGLRVGDQQPYSGTVLNATMNRHAEARAIPYLGVELRQDQIAEAAGQARWAQLLAPVVQACARALA